MRIVIWFFRALVFFVLFAFALNNRHDASVHGFFGTVWQAPLVIVILAAFAVGCALGVVAMVPAWWRRERAAERKAMSSQGAAVPDGTQIAEGDSVSAPLPPHPPREGL